MMCLEKQQAEQLREFVKEIDQAIDGTDTTFPAGKHPSHCVQGGSMRLVMQHIKRQTINDMIALEDRAKRIEANALERAFFAIMDNRPAIILLLLLLFGEKIIPILLK